MRYFYKIIFPYLSLLILFAVSLVTLKLFITNGMYLFTYEPKAMDFIAFYTGASLLFQNPTEMYNLLEQEKIQHHLIPAAKTTNVFLPFFNPPFVALLTAPLALLPIIYAYTIWTVINIILLVIICFLFYRNIPLSKTNKILSIIGMLTFIPVLTSLLLGQLTFVMTFILFIAWMLLRQGHEFRSGLILSLLLIKPHFFLVPFLAFLIQRRWNVVKGLTIGVVILSFISLSILGREGIQEYIQLLINATSWNSGYGIDIKAQHSLQTLLLIIFQTDALTTIRFAWTIAVIVVASTTLFFWRKQYVFNSQAFALQFAMLILASLLISPHTHFHDFMLLIVVGIALSQIIIKQSSKNHNYFSLLISLGYFICLAGYILELYFINTSRLGWITITVSYLLIFWIYTLYSLTKIQKK